MKNENIDNIDNIDFNNFNHILFIRKLKQAANQSIILGKFHITDNIKEVKQNYRSIYKMTNCLVRNPLIFDNGLIYVVINEILSFISNMKQFQKSIKTSFSIDGITTRQQKFFDMQKTIIIHLREMKEDPTAIPSFAKKDIYE